MKCRSTKNKHDCVKGSFGSCWAHGEINRLRPSQVTERHGLEAMRGAGLASNKGAYTRPKPTHLFESREKRQARRHGAKHHRKRVTNKARHVNIRSQNWILTAK